jgi:hypothetical protein
MLFLLELEKQTFTNIHVYILPVIQGKHKMQSKAI